MPTSFTADTRAFVRWEKAVYAELYAAAKPLLDAGHEFIDALAAAQSHLPEHMQRDQDGLERALRAAPMAEAIALYKRLTPAGRADLVRRLKLRGDVVEALPDGHRIHWTDRELALVDRRILYMRITLGDKRKVWYQLEDAQRIELPRERWRTLTSLKAPRGRDESLARLARKGRLRECEELLKDEPPFNACKAPLLTAEALAAPQAQPELEPQPEPQATGSPSPADINAYAYSAPPAKSLAELVREAAASLPPPETRQEPSQAIQAPQASPTPEKSPGGPMAAVAGQLVGLITSLFDAVATHHAATAANEYRRISEQVTTAAIEAVDARLQQLVPIAVAKVMEELLGPGTHPPQVDMPPLKVDLSGAGLDVPRVKLDVVGLFPRQVAEVKKALNGYADNVRFIDADKVNADWAPRDVVIASNKVALRVVEDKCRKAHVPIHRVWGSATSVVNAVREVYAGAGVELH